MRTLLMIAFVIIGTLAAAPAAMARVSHEQAFSLCIAQPALQAESMTPIIELELSRPHDPALDSMSKEQLLNAIQYTEGNRCAAQIVAHPDVFAALAAQQYVSDYNWQAAWDALNTACRNRMTGVCIREEVAAGVAIRDANAQGMTPSFRACSLALIQDADSVQTKRCMDTTGGQRPDDGVMLSCVSSVGWHSQSDGATAGRRLGLCFKRDRQDR